ncbi:class II fructose-bisphosphate aldolase [Streptomyces sp. NPDC000880]
MLTLDAGELTAARKERRAIGAFTTYNLETTTALCRAAEATGQPVLLQLGAGVFRHVDLGVLTRLVIDAAGRSPAQLGVHLDHSRDLQEIQACLDLGCSSVMVDGSHLPFEENISLTKAAVAAGHRAGAWVEGELGAIPGDEDRSVAAQQQELLTDPAQAAEFAARTGVDALAVQIGNVHGFSHGGGRLDLDRLAAIAAAVPVPLVLHGASGIDDDVLRAAIGHGVAKINVNAELRRACFSALEETLAPARDDGYHLQGVLNAARDAVAAAAENRIRLFADLPQGGQDT